MAITFDMSTGVVERRYEEPVVSTTPQSLQHPDQWTGLQLMTVAEARWLEQQQARVRR
ncbi:hypothetical protein [Chitinivorax sp. B]|uniref:hypothetical protein n=1 Tax=Chitinivorax sp. B TaxID=2502235 RepID=UPI0014858167|nr:hypothetical protein [Chitinivorax sp. B]